MKKISFLLFGIILSLAVFSQKPVINFDIKSYDFGKITEEAGKADYSFTFTNTGNSPLVVSRVQASCGCTTPTWTKEPIEPGKSGSILVSYNPTGRPGAFVKSITVYSNASEEQVGLIIKGNVVPKSNIENSFPVVMGDLRISSKVVQMNNIEKGKVSNKTVQVLNTGKSNLSPTIVNLPAHIKVSIEPSTIKPNDEATIVFTLDSKNCNQWGPVSDDVYVSINNQRKNTEEFKLHVFSNIIEDFSSLTLDQKRKSPIFAAATRTVDYGTIKTGSKKAAKLKISNNGLSTLEIRRILNNNAELNVHHSKMSIASGKSSFMIIDLISANLPEGEYKKTITIQTNDPDNSFIIIALNWRVIK